METLRNVYEVLAANRWAQAAAILAASVLAAFVVDFVLVRILRPLAARTETQTDEQIVNLLHVPIFVTVLLVGFGSITAVLELPDAVALALRRLLKTLAVLLWAWVGARAATLVFEGLGRLKTRFPLFEDAIVQLFVNASKVILIAAAVYFLFLTWNINVTAWLASAGIVGIAVGFAAKDTIANLFGGVSILVDRPYKAGDYIRLDTGERGMVTRVGLRATRLLTRDDVEIIIPNSVMTLATIVNETGGPWEKTRIRLPVGVAYGSDIDAVEETLLSVAGEHARVCREPAPRVRFRRFGESGLEIELLCWIEMPALRGLVEHELNCAIYKEFQRRGIVIPFPQRDVHLIESAAGTSHEAPRAGAEPAADSVESAARSGAGWAPASAADPAAGGGASR